MRLANITEEEMQAMRQEFERLASDPSYKFAKSRKGNYVNPSLARDWKWFVLGYYHRKVNES